MLSRLLAPAVLLLAAGSLHGETSLDAARALMHEHRLPEARAALEKIVAAEPKNAAACHELGMVWRGRRDAEAYAEAVKWLKQAADLEPSNARYLADYGGTSMEYAGLTTSIGAATAGRDAMEKAVQLDPNDLDTREGLLQFYLRAPFFVGGSSRKAAAQLEEIRQRDPHRAVAIDVLIKANAKDYAAAFKLCDDLLATTPDHYTALYQYGRTASVSGQNLERGLERLKKCLTLTPPSPASPSHSNVWNRVGNLEEKLGHTEAARSAYTEALKLDPSNRQASNALAKLPPAAPAAPAPGT